MQIIATLTSKGQVTIPKMVREMLALRKNDRLIFTQLSKDVVAIKPIKGDLLSFGGSIKPKNKPENFQQVRAETLKRLGKTVVKRAKR